MNTYYELNDGWVANFGAKYFTADEHKILGYVSRRIMEISDRVWTEDGNMVRFIKNRNSHCGHVDMKEFMWIKLQSKVI